MNKLRSLLRACAWWILGNVKPQENEVDKALRVAFAEIGLNIDNYAPETILGNKALALVFHASEKLGNPIITLQDVKELLS